MTKLLLITLSLLTMACARQPSHPEPVNPDASPEARELLDFLYSLNGKYTLSGVHNYANHLSVYSDSFNAITGHRPAIWGSDLSSIGSSYFDRQKVVDEAVRQYRMGSIITLMSHQARPYEHEPVDFRESVQGPFSDEEWTELVTPGTEMHTRWLGKIDSLAFFLKELQEEHIPVLWRPYHEMNGIWFWWGDRKGPEGFRKLWAMMYHRFVNYHKLDNILWVWNTNAPRDWKDDEAYAYDLYYPGDSLVDILAADVYKNDFKLSHHDDLLKLANGKLIALGEVGIAPTPEILDQQ
ncbi:MAG TPA: glycosyl hydrolase, partial [Bacteroidales bacterium]|nr:glycosyl hydrolase [Bacteroidales bacterium]